METPKNQTCRKTDYQKVTFEQKLLSLTKSTMDKFLLTLPLKSITFQKQQFFPKELILMKLMKRNSKLFKKNLKIDREKF
jgi:hypothetical protein